MLEADFIAGFALGAGLPTLCLGAWIVRELFRSRGTAKQQADLLNRLMAKHLAEYAAVTKTGIPVQVRQQGTTPETPRAVVGPMVG